jgi:hydrogenase maturation protein HypF
MHPHGRRSLQRTRRIRIRLIGQVQGVGFRPFVWNRATGLQLSGFVRNDSSGVTLEIQGEHWRVERFVHDFQKEMPALAVVDSFTKEEMPSIDGTGFAIIDSSASRTQSTPITPDIATCDDCLAELKDRNDRRYGYPFTNCTNCGPRFTIVEDIPYDRPMTTMKSFEMCDPCRQEYADPADRRFHAQPNACADCGPAIWFTLSSQVSDRLQRPKDLLAGSQAAIDQFAAAVRDGQIVAVKGVGGFHLVCDAGNPQAVATLRERKGRINKPFAVMVENVEKAAAFARAEEAEQLLLESRERPIVLLRKRGDSGHDQMLDCVAPGNDFIGVMLPYSPLHHLLVESAGPLLMTSGNVSDEPIVRTNAEAKDRLAALADCFLLHDRDIHIVCDDSVVRCVNGQIIPIRRSRGYAPMPIRLAEIGPSVLAVGGELKSTFCVTKDDYAYMSQHIGDVGNVETLDALGRTVEHFLRLFRVDVAAVAADLHPDYLSSRWARQLAEKLDVPLVPVQHHLAHAASLIGEQRWGDDRHVLACCFDGTGFGTDEAIWGGEFLLASGNTFDRVAHLKYFSLPGGDASVRKPFRTALALLSNYRQPWDERLPCVASCSAHERRILRRQLDQTINCASTSSMGRLFDAVASLIGVRHVVSYEAQAAMEMEAIASEMIDVVDSDAYQFEIEQRSLIEIGCGSLLNAMCRDIVNGVQTSRIAAQFHHAVANMVAAVCTRIRENTGEHPVGLTGGVFQNVLLLQLVDQRLREGGFDVLGHAIVPPNDGGLALGQAVVARNRLLASG